VTASERPELVIVDTRTLEITTGLDRRRAEALALELRALAKRLGIDVAGVRVLPGERLAARVAGDSGQASIE
jgi:hypothetical protein